MEPDRKYLSKLQDYYAANRILPSYSTIGRLVGLSSKSSVAALVQRLKEAGFLELTRERRLRPATRFFERTVSDTVRAGSPAPANEVGYESMAIDDFLIKKPSATTLFKVKGDSMVEAGIYDGDLVVIEKKAGAQPGDVVLAIVDNEFTLKYLALDRRGFFLRPGNKAYAPIRPESDLEIFGVYVGLVRKGLPKLEH